MVPEPQRLPGEVDVIVGVELIDAVIAVLGELSQPVLVLYFVT
jgi:hypothetical protein